MNRKDLLHSSAGMCAGSLILQSLGATSANAQTDSSQDKAALVRDREFVEHWTADMLDAMEQHLDRETQEKLVGACGRGCYDRYEFKQAIARAGACDLEKLMEAYSENFEIWREGNIVHLRYGEVSPVCYCVAARNRKAKPNDIHCECTRVTHKTVFEIALGRPFKVEILESVRRGGKTCHFLIHLS